MNQRGAIRATIVAARQASSWFPKDGPCSIAHFEDMESRLTDDMSDAKVGRWLGYIQGVMCALGPFPLDDLKAINKEFADH